MTITDEQRETAYETASEMQKDLYEGQANAMQLSAIATQHAIARGDVYTDFLIAIGDVILGLVSQTQLPQLLIERIAVQQATAMRITADVLDFLEPLNSTSTDIVSTTQTVPEIATTTEPIPTTPTTETTPITVTPPAYNTVAQNDALAQEIAQAEAQFHELQPIRTMAHDMDTLKQADQGAEATHQAASQEDLLTKKTPETTQTNGRWGT